MTKNTLIDPKIDLASKRIFGCSTHPIQLLDLVNAILQAFGETTIKELTVLNPARNSAQLKDKSAILDIRAKTDLGELINIEMQMVNQYNWRERSLYYWSKLFQEQLPKGDKYTQLKKTISISLLDFKLFDRNRMHSLYEIKERDDHERLSDLIQMYFVELPKNTPEDIPPHLRDWIAFFRAKTASLLQRKLNISLQINF